MIISDVFDSNFNAFVTELTIKIAKVSDVRIGLNPGGDFHETVNAQLKVLNAAKSAAQAAYDELMQPPQPVNPEPHGTGVITWGERLTDAESLLGRRLTFREIKALSELHVMTEAELNLPAGVF